MLSAINRFQNKIKASNQNAKFDIITAYTNTNSNQFVNFNKYGEKTKKPSIELYYSNTNGFSELKKIMDNGFEINNWYGNHNEVGITLHSSPETIIQNYCSHSVLICYVIADLFYVKKCGSKFHGLDYLVANPKLIYPKYLLNFELELNNKPNSNALYSTILKEDVMEMKKY